MGPRHRVLRKSNVVDFYCGLLLGVGCPLAGRRWAERDRTHLVHLDSAVVRVVSPSLWSDPCSVPCSRSPRSSLAPLGAGWDSSLRWVQSRPTPWRLERRRQSKKSLRFGEILFCNKLTFFPLFLPFLPPPLRLRHGTLWTTDKASSQTSGGVRAKSEASQRHRSSNR